MSSVTLSGANARLSYSLKGSHIAKLRCSQLSINYGVYSDESKAKRYRAFYPYLRVQGGFAMTFDCKGWGEYERVMDWFQAYVEALIDEQSPSYMQVQLDARQFLRLAYPTTGIEFGDHVGSMVFSPSIAFVSVADPRDPKADIGSLNSSVSRTSLPGGSQTSTQWFYPNSKLNNPGQLQSYLYNQQVAAAAAVAAELQDVLIGATPGGDPYDDQNTIGGKVRAV